MAPTATQRAIALRVAMYTLVTGCWWHRHPGLFGISIDDLRIAGGLVVFLIALDMLNGDHSDSHYGSASKKTEFPSAEAVAFYPLTFPILMVPGTITTLIVYSGQATSLPDKMALGAMFLALVVLIGVVFNFGAEHGRYPGPTARSIMSRLMGMVLAAIVIDMSFTGLKSLLPGLG